MGHRWNLPIFLTAFIPLFVTSPSSRAVEVAIGVGSWLVFLIDLAVQRRITPDYLHRAQGRFDLVVVIATFGDALWWGVVTLTTGTGGRPEDDGRQAVRGRDHVHRGRGARSPRGFAGVDVRDRLREGRAR